MGRGKSGRGGRGGRSRRGRGRGRGGFSRRSPRALLRGLLDKVLEGVVTSLPLWNGQVQEGGPVALLLRFEGELELGVTTSSDGESIRVTRKPVSPYPEDDPEMDVMPEEQTESEDWAFFVGKKCEDVHEVRDMSFGGKGTWVGLELHFEGGAILYAYNWGDELLLEAPPEDAVFLERKSVRKKPGEDGDDADDEDTGGKDSGKRRSRKRTSGQDDGDAGEDDSDDDESEDDSDDDQGSDDSGDGDGDDESDGDDGEGRPRRRPRRRRSRSRRGKKESSGEG